MKIKKYTFCVHATFDYFDDPNCFFDMVAYEENEKLAKQQLRLELKELNDKGYVVRAIQLLSEEELTDEANKQ